MVDVAVEESNHDIWAQCLQSTVLPYWQLPYWLNAFTIPSHMVIHTICFLYNIKLDFKPTNVGKLFWKTHNWLFKYFQLIKFSSFRKLWKLKWDCLLSCRLKICLKHCKANIVSLLHSNTRDIYWLLQSYIVHDVCPHNWESVEVCKRNNHRN